MKYSGLLSSCLLLVLVAVIILACGSPGYFLKSVSITPATADAQNYPNDAVQFVATGYYTMPPLRVTPLTAGWGACYQGNATTGVSVSKTGLAQCAAGSVGTYTVWASAPSGSTGPCSDLISPCGVAECQVTGTAQLTCP